MNCFFNSAEAQIQHTSMPNYHQLTSMDQTERQIAPTSTASNYHQPTPVMGFSNQHGNQEHIPTLSRFRPMAIDRAAIVTPFKFLKAASANQERLLNQRKVFNVSIDLSSSQFPLKNGKGFKCLSFTF
jgi:hypothetical protein